MTTGTGPFRRDLTTDQRAVLVKARAQLAEIADELHGLRTEWDDWKAGRTTEVPTIARFPGS